VNSSTWGAVRTADVQLAGETAHAIPVQIIGDHSVGKVPSACTSGGFPATNTAADLGANGVLGVGNYLADCGPACAASGASNPGQYYECGPPEGCRVTAVDESNQVSHPVASFAADNNGVVLEFPAVTVETRSLTGTMRFGIGTQANNALGDAKVFTFDRLGFLTAKYRGASLPFSFVDSGSAVFYFPDQDIPTCTDFEGLYCPQSDLKRSVTMVGANGASHGIGFTVGNADELLTHPNSVFATVCSTSLLPGATDLIGPSSFDWGLPFYFGRTVFTAIEGKPTPGGAGPYVAYTP